MINELADQRVKGLPSAVGRVVAVWTTKSSSSRSRRRGRPPAHRGLRRASPISLNLWIRSRTVSSSAWTARAMTGTVLPRAEASSIIGRRNRTELLLPRGPSAPLPGGLPAPRAPKLTAHRVRSRFIEGQPRRRGPARPPEAGRLLRRNRALGRGLSSTHHAALGGSCGRSRSSSPSSEKRCPASPRRTAAVRRVYGAWSRTPPHSGLWFIPRSPEAPAGRATHQRSGLRYSGEGRCPDR